MCRPLAERFWEKVDKNGLVPAHRPELGPCWLWTGGLDKDGYGVFGWGSAGGTTRAHRTAYTLCVGPVPDGLHVLHHCDNPPCVNPQHLWAGTNLENHQDKARKGRAPVPWATLHPEELLRGEQHPNAKLTALAVEDIRQNYVPRKVPLSHFAKKYGVRLSTVHWALKGGTWSGVGDGR